MKKKIFRLVENNTFKLNESSLPTYDTTITVTDPATDEERDVDVTVEYEYTSFSPGSREPGTGLLLSPDEPASIDIYSVYDKDGKEYELTKAQKAHIEAEIAKDIADRRDDDYDDYYDQDR